MKAGKLEGKKKGNMPSRQLRLQKKNKFVGSEIHYFVIVNSGVRRIFKEGGTKLENNVNQKKVFTQI